MGRSIRVLFAMTILAGCRADTDEVDPAVPVVRVTMTDELFLDTIPIATIGGDRTDAGHALYLIQDARFLPSGGVALAEKSSNTVLLFDSLGSFQMALGRAGEGPGEFKLIRSVHPIAGDTIAAWDAVTARVTFFVSDAPPVTADPRTAADPHGLRESARYEPFDLHVLAPDQFISIHQSHSHDVRKHSRWPMFISIINGRGEYVAHVGERAGAEWYRGVQFPLARRFYGATAGDVFYTGDGTGDLSAFDSSGAAVRRIRVPLPRAAVGEAELREAIDAFLDLASSSARQSVADILADVPFPDSTPAYTAVRGSQNDRLWVRAYARPGEDPRRWLVVDPAAGTAAALDIPRRYNVMDATADRVLVSTRDAEDRETYILFRYGRADPGPLTRGS